MNEDKATRYHRLKRRVSLVSALWSATLLSALVVSGGAVALRDVVTDLTGLWFLHVAFYVLALAVVHEIGGLPIAWYSGHVLERRYGLSRQSWGQWVGDHLKGTAVGLLLAIGAAVVLYGLMARWPDSWWAPAALAFALLLIVLAHLAPVLLLPLFFRFRPLNRPALRERLERLAADAGTRVVGIFQWELGRKTVRANAALAGLGGTRRILIADTMLEQYSDDEIEVVLAHEMAHHVHGDIWRSIALESGLLVAGFYVAFRVLDWLGPAVGVGYPADPAGLPLLLLAVGAASIVLLPVALAVSRAHERRADRFALELTGKPEAFASAMRRLGTQNLAEERPSRLVRWLFHSHPPLDERLRLAAEWRPAQ